MAESSLLEEKILQLLDAKAECARRSSEAVAQRKRVAGLQDEIKALMKEQEAETVGIDIKGTGPDDPPTHHKVTFKVTRKAASPFNKKHLLSRCVEFYKGSEEKGEKLLDFLLYGTEERVTETLSVTSPRGRGTKRPAPAAGMDEDDLEDEEDE